MNVYELTQQRLKRIFDDFDYVYVSFSGGKDSGVLLNLCIDYIKKHCPGRHLGVFHIDYEAQYQMTTDYVDRVFSDDFGGMLDFYRVCMPICASCCTSMTQTHWKPWEKSKQNLWVRPLPQNCICEDNHQFDFWRDGIWDYTLQEEFGPWLSRKLGVKKVCCLVGIRTQESMNRWRTIYAVQHLRHNYEGLNWTTHILDDVYTAYPLYDWKTEDVWVANARFAYDYNKVYDLYYMAGLNIDQMRVASPFHDCGQENLQLYRVIDPDNWGKMVGRVNGANFTAIYGGTAAMGWKDISLPEGHTWKSYLEFLLSTLPETARSNYETKMQTSQQFWRSRGGVLSDAVIANLKRQGVKIRVMASSNYKTDKHPVRMEWVDDYKGEDFQLVPSYKRMCICIMKNDHLCKYMGFSQTRNEAERTKKVMEQYKNLQKLQ